MRKTTARPGNPWWRSGNTDWGDGTWGEMHRQAGQNQYQYLRRKGEHDGWCGNTASEWMFVGQPLTGSLLLQVLKYDCNILDSTDTEA